MRFSLLLIWSLLVMLPIRHLSAQAHHTPEGFHNPWPGFEDRGLGDLFKWMIWDRITGKKPDRPDTYHFKVEANDGRFLRKNHTQNTITWIGHSTLLIQLDGLNILTDPIWSERASPVQFMGPKRFTPPGVAFNDLPSIDVVLISHDHYDHLDKNTIQRLGNKPFYLVPLGVGDLLKSWGITHFQELDWWDEITFNHLRFVCTPAQHFSGRTPFDRNLRLWAGWVIQGKDKKIYFGGDSGYFPGFQTIGTRLGPFDLAALPIGAYKPRWFMSAVHMDPAEAVRAYLDLKAKIFVPIHWATFDLADEPLDEPPKLLKKAIHKQQLNADNFWILKVGEMRILHDSIQARANKNFNAKNEGQK